MSEDEKWGFSATRDGIIIKVIKPLTRDEAITLGNSLVRFAQETTELLDKKTFVASLESRRFDYATRDITPIRKAKKRESKGPY